jgi:hypothetical protein
MGVRSVAFGGAHPIHHTTQEPKSLLVRLGQAGAGARAIGALVAISHGRAGDRRTSSQKVRFVRLDEKVLHLRQADL